jgi:Xaa-Pro aminopeptidase
MLQKRGRAVKSDLDKLMSQRGLDAVVVLGGTEHNPIMYYVTDGANLSSGVYIHKRGQAPHLVYSPIERDNAAATGLDLSSYAQHGLANFLEKETNEAFARAAFYSALLKTFGVTGRVAFYGKQELSLIMPTLQRLGETAKEIELVPDPGISVFEEARTTKEPHEVDRMRAVGEGCEEAIGQVVEFIRSCKADGAAVVDSDGERVTLGRLKKVLRFELMRRGLVESKGSIVAMGSEAAVPHNYGTDENELRIETSLIMDVFPSEFAGGYHFDITRTFCLGEAPAAVRKVYHDVMEVQMDCISALKVGDRGWDYQNLACELFEKKGYETLRQNDKITEGYVHNLGHGIGLEVHERPRLAGPPTNTDVILPGSVFTIEPGLYFPSKAIAARLEDMVYAREDGSFENLTTFPKELEIPLK